jgi:uncharacterized membrane protein
MTAIPFTPPQIVLLAQILGLPAVIVIMWWVDQKRLDRQQVKHEQAVAERREEHEKEVAEILARYEKDVNKVSTFYERNVELVERYAKLSDDLSGIIHLNTQVQTKLVEQIKTNMFCPAIREKGPERN